MTTFDTMFAAAPSDADLVERSLKGGSGAFWEIVARHQTLVCSLTYNGTGSLSRSEDLAQDVSVTTWSKLREPRELAKLSVTWLPMLLVIGQALRARKALKKSAAK